MQLLFDAAIEPSPGCALSTIDGGTLHVAPCLAGWAATHSLLTSEAFAGYAVTFPSSLASALGWRVDDVAPAVELLRLQVLGAGVPAPSRAYGYRTPMPIDEVQDRATGWIAGGLLQWLKGGPATRLVNTHIRGRPRDAEDVPIYDQAALDAAVAAERERCAKLCDFIAGCGPDNSGCCPTHWDEAAERCANEIRAAKENP